MRNFISEFFRKNKQNIIIGLVLWIVISIVLVLPFTIATAVASKDGAFNINVFMNVFQQAFSQPFKAFNTLSRANLFGIFFKYVGISGLAILILLVIAQSKNHTYNYKNIEHGSSDWSKNGEQYKILSNKKGIILAENNYLPVDKQGNVNVLVVGGSGAGKSASYSIPNAYQKLGSYVFTDPKGELYDATAGYLRENGYKIKVLNLVHPQYSDGYNPLMHVSSQIDVDVIAHTIVKGQKTEGSGSDPFWDDSAETLLKALIYYLLATRPEEEQNLASCAELVRAANSNGGSNMLSDLMSKLPYDHPARMNYKSIEIAPEKTYSSILSTLQSKLGKFDSKDIAELTSTDTIDFDSIGTEKTAVYVISPDTHTTYNFLLTIFFSQMIQQLYDFADNNGGTLQVPTYFILDEFANIGQIPDFDKKISTSRSRKISFSVILQNLDQLEEIYDKAYETIIGNCDTHVFLGSNSQKTVEYFSKALGEKTITHYSVSTSRDKQHKKTGTSNSDQIMARALMTPDELRRMDNDLCIIFEKGVRPVKANKFYYFKHPMVKELEEKSISHNDIGEIERGTWRKFNPYNPYVEEEDKEKKVKDLKVESLDDLFEDENIEEPKSEKVASAVSNSTEKTEALPIDLDEFFDEDNSKSEIKPKETGSKPLFKDDEYDLQKELEAKFDELFGAVDED